MGPLAGMDNNEASRRSTNITWTVSKSVVCCVWWDHMAAQDQAGSWSSGEDDQIHLPYVGISLPTCCLLLLRPPLPYLKRILRASSSYSYPLTSKTSFICNGINLSSVQAVWMKMKKGVPRTTTNRVNKSQHTSIWASSGRVGKTADLAF